MTIDVHPPVGVDPAMIRGPASTEMHRAAGGMTEPGTGAILRQ
jgi:hypothetical protein